MIKIATSTKKVRIIIAVPFDSRKRPMEIPKKAAKALMMSRKRKLIITKKDYLVPFFRQPKEAAGLCTSARHIKVTGFEPMALCTQNRCADQTALHLVSPPG